MTKYQPSDLILEVTRFCNMECPHCIRGEFQRMKMPLNVIDAVLEPFAGGYISLLGVSGGEPATAPDRIEYILQRCIDLKIEVGAFWVVTNGKIHSHRFLNSLRAWFEYTSEPEMNSLRISDDNFHEGIDQEPWNRFQEEMGYEGVQFSLDWRGADERNLIGDGRALDNYECSKMVEHSAYAREEQYLNDGQGGFIIDAETYISAKGDVISTCDISFDLMDDRDDQFNLGNILNESMDDIYSRFFEKHPERVS